MQAQRHSEGLSLTGAVQEQTAVRPRDYLSLLWIVAAAALGLSLMCGVAAVGISDINNAIPFGTPTSGIVEFAIANMNTLIVETVQAFSLPVEFSQTPSPSPSSTTTGTTVPTSTHVLLNSLPGFTPGTSTTSHPQSGQASFTPIVIPTNTPKPTATATYVPPTSTYTLVPTPIDTPIPDTSTPVPTASYTPVPPDTDTPVPPDSDTPIPPDTDTPVPPDTDTPGP